MSDHAAAQVPLAGRRAEDLPAHWLLARLGKKVLRPGGKQLTTRLVGMLPLRDADVVELAPGLGLTAKLLLEAGPASYIGVENDADAAALAAASLGARGEVTIGEAKSTGLADASCDVVLTEAMLTMHTNAQKGEILDEVARILRPGGCYAVHELALVPDDIPIETAEDVRLSLVRSQKVNTRPQTTPEWIALFAAHGFEVEHVVHAPMRLLHFRRLLADEGLRGTLHIAGTYLRDADVRRRVNTMRAAFRRNEKHIAAIAIIARRAAASTPDTEEAP
ncbi:class I SAM-dependent methyltransferase [Microbacterium protaetiae]|uniref:Class I SAM-dependent methyltransferase n=1 Tax=Microbacterium protaetiae TaxID=2509458 RepID=A0A4P6EBC7_9MICO|nr:class I SAM-dependent methyltransferase [Microbacterium protaetiae]QAY59462.1 class I SAM-dependent methyltransferase [Microbacterium protaetiae]